MKHPAVNFQAVLVMETLRTIKNVIANLEVILSSVQLVTTVFTNTVSQHVCQRTKTPTQDNVAVQVFLVGKVILIHVQQRFQKEKQAMDTKDKRWILEAVAVLIAKTCMQIVMLLIQAYQ